MQHKRHAVARNQHAMVGTDNCVLVGGTVSTAYSVSLWEIRRNGKFSLLSGRSAQPIFPAFRRSAQPYLWCSDHSFPLASLPAVRSPVPRLIYQPSALSCALWAISDRTARDRRPRALYLVVCCSITVQSRLSALRSTRTGLHNSRYTTLSLLIESVR